MEIATSTLTAFKAGRIEPFYAHVYPSLLTFAARYLGSDYGFLAEDCVQEAVFKAYVRRNNFQTPSQFKSFLYACVHNNTVSLLRKQQSWSHYAAEQAADTTLRHGEDFTRAMIEQETLDLLYEAIGRLPADLQQVFELSFERGMKNAEVAEAMHLSESAIKKKKARMIGLLRNDLAGNTELLLLVAQLLMLPS